jgi:hypothetical protein
MGRKMRGTRRGKPWAVTVASILAMGGCYSGLSSTLDGTAADDGATGDDDGGGSGGDDDSTELDCESSVSPLRRLSEAQYSNTLRDLFAPAGVDVEASAASDLARIPVDDPGSTFGILDVRVSELHVRAYYRLADRLASIVVNDVEVLSALAGDCALESSPTATCIDDFLDDFGLRTHRRPLTSEERTHYHELATQAEDGVDSFRTLVFSLLLSPQFLYHVEVEGPGDDDRFEVGAYELASRLSFHFWQTMPDDELLAAAASGSLLSEDGYLEQLDRVFEDPRTMATVDRFYDEWLHLGWLTTFPNTPAFATFAEGTSVGEAGADHLAAAWEEIHALTRYFTFEQEGTLSDILLTDLSFTSSPHLAALYGVEPWDGLSDPPRMPAGERAGILTRTALLVSGTHETDPVHRGATVRRRILCDSLPSPDPAALPPGALDAPPVTEHQTTRERYEEKTSDPVCAACHSLINPAGFVLERYDGLGRHRSEETVIDRTTGEVIATLPIDSSARPALSGNDTVISSGPELSQEVVASGKAEACFARQYFRATFGREETLEDRCAIDRVETVLQDGGSMREALRAVALDPMFRFRRVN